jgi:hypothetical protein
MLIIHGSIKYHSSPCELNFVCLFFPLRVSSSFDIVYCSDSYIWFLRNIFYLQCLEKRKKIKKYYLLFTVESHNRIQISLWLYCIWRFQFIWSRNLSETLAILCGLLQMVFGTTLLSNVSWLLLFEGLWGVLVWVRAWRKRNLTQEDYNLS